mmetsp:Transcript_11454/g.21913  ORF Transcript_11454/g.21913 Transcript_11454/m.21913 type:complete len:424 (-) Transcript_11454:51-1322(-)
MSIETSRRVDQASERLIDVKSPTRSVMSFRSLRRDLLQRMLVAFWITSALLWHGPCCCAMATTHTTQPHKSNNPKDLVLPRHQTRHLNGAFGLCLERVTRADLQDPAFQQTCRELWLHQGGGLLALRGDELATLTPQELMDWSKVFGKVQDELPSARQDMAVPGYPILRIGNIKSDGGKLVAQFTNVPALQTDADIQYNPATQRPVWHTDGTFQQYPPIGSVFHCRQTPPADGGATLFADTVGAYAQLQHEQLNNHDDDNNPLDYYALQSLEAICSLAHHDQKVHSYTPEYPTLTAEQRAANPPQRVPLVLRHPVTGKLALYGLNSSTCAIVPCGQAVTREALDQWDLQGVEDESVQRIWRRQLLPFVTRSTFTVKWTWQPGDIVVWDNRCTIHAATGFDRERYGREMWRVTLVEDSKPVKTM